MNKTFVVALIASVLASADFVLAGVLIKEDGFLLILSGGFFFLAVTLNQYIEYYKQCNVKNEILHELDSQKAYIVRERMKSGFMSLIDLTTMTNRLADIPSPYPPEGFTEEITDERTFLVPDRKKLAIGHKSEFVFAPKMSGT